MTRPEILRSEECRKIFVSLLIRKSKFQKNVCSLLEDKAWILNMEESVTRFILKIYVKILKVVQGTNVTKGIQWSAIILKIIKRCKSNWFCSYRHDIYNVDVEENILKKQVKNLKKEVAYLEIKVSVMARKLDTC